MRLTAGVTADLEGWYNDSSNWQERDLTCRTGGLTVTAHSTGWKGNNFTVDVYIGAPPATPSSSAAATA